MNGENLYKSHSYYGSPCITLISRFKNENNIIRAVEKMLQYHFDLNYRARGKYYFQNSVLETLYSRKKYRVLEYLDKLTNRPRKEIKCHSTTVTITKIDNGVMTFFQNSELQFITFFTPVSTLTNKQFNSFYEGIFKKVFIFDSKMEETIILQLKKQAPGNYVNYIDRIFQNGSLIGFNIYQVFDQFNNDYPNHVLIHHFYSALHPDTRSCGIMNNINFHIPYSLKKLLSLKETHFPPKEIVIFYSVLTFDAIKATVDFLSAPHYRFPKFQEYLKSILKVVFSHSPNLIYEEKDNIECSMDDSLVKVKAGNNNINAENEKVLHKKQSYKTELSTINIHKKLYLETLGKKNNAIPTLFFADLINLKVIIERSKKNGVNFEKFVTDFSLASASIFTEQFNNVKLLNSQTSILSELENENPFWNATEHQNLRCKF